VTLLVGEAGPHLT